ncbi:MULTISPECIES: hypothetical protein [Bradyrhizobium]|uniref:hypothetical protein n=1 Tax=Bradyrhizobium pachyrhizi TaxID=280333 RepID=UPI000481A401
MYGRIVGSSSQSTRASQADESGEAGDSPRFAETVAGIESGGSSSAPYSNDSDPPIIEIEDRSTFMEGVRRYLGGDIRDIVSNPQEYSRFVSKKAERAAMVAGGYSSKYDDPNIEAKFYSYQLGDESVGLLRVGSGPVEINEERLRRQFGRDDITSVVDLRVTHPLVENAGDILLEHQLRIDGANPLVLSRPALDGMERRLGEMGFVHVGDNDWVLDPNRHPEVWTKNENSQWQRVDRPTKYLSKVVEDEVQGADNDSDAATSIESNASSDDDPSFYLERYLQGLRMG